jgi:DNA polymerase III alpha subunit
MKIDFDVDIDMANREDFLRLVNHTPASIKNGDGAYSKHNTGVYFQTIPTFPLEGFSSIDYETAEEEGWFKVDVLNNGIYKDVKDEAHLQKLMDIEPLWDLLEHEEFVRGLFHISNYSKILAQYKPKSIEQLAMILAIIRPGKKYLMGKRWEEIAASVWTKPADGSYYFKHSHAVAYAVAIVVQMNLICEKTHSLYA